MTTIVGHTRIRRTKDDHLVRLLERICFPDDDPYPTAGAQWWIATADGFPVAFAGAKMWQPDQSVFLCRSGVIPQARGHGLHRRLIRTRFSWARSEGALAAYTYTAPWNNSSSNNLIRCGFRLWTPGKRWGGEEMLYWIRDC